MTLYSSRKYTKFWQEGLLLGNGRIGAIISGKRDREEISLSHHNNFLTSQKMLQVPNMKTELNTFQNILNERGQDSAVDFFYNKSKKKGYGGLTMSDIVHPSLQFKIIHNGSYDDVSYKQGISIKNKCVNIKDIKRKFQASISGFEEMVLVYNCQVKGTSTIKISEVINEKLKVNKVIDGDKILIKQLYMDNSIVSSEIKFESDGEIESTNDGTKIVDYTYLEICIKSQYSDRELIYNGDKSKAKFRTTAEKSEEIYVDKLNNNENINLLIDSFYELSTYYIDSYSGQGIPGLQGVWSGDFYPAWSGDYTFDTNVQLAIDSYLSLGKVKSMYAVLEHILSYSEDFEINAKQYFGCNGFLVPAHASTTALDVHWNPEWPLLFWLSGAGWLSHYFHEYYKYTLDETFLRLKALPFYEKTLEFYLDFGLNNDNYEINLAYSAENGLGKNPTMDIAVIRMMIKYLKETYRILEIPSTKQIKFDELEKKLPNYMVRDNVVTEWIDENKKENHNHRHFSHFFPVFVSKEIHNKHPLFEVYRNTFKVKIHCWLNNEQPDTSSTHGKMQAMMIATSLEMDEIFDLCMSSFFKGKSFYKFLNSSHYENEDVFNIDATGSFPKVINDAMIYVEHDGSITLNKIQSQFLGKGILNNIVLANGIEVKEFKWDRTKKYVYLNLVVHNKQDIKINYLHQSIVYNDVSGNLIYTNEKTL